MDDKKALELARDAYSASTTYFDANVRGQAENDLRQFNGQHPTGSKYFADAYKARSKLFRPKTRAMIRKNEAVCASAYFSTADVVNIAPYDDSNPIELAAASFYQGLIQYRLTHTIPWFMTLVGAYQDAQTVGAVVSKQSWLYDPVRRIDGPQIELIPIENFRIDPGADWIDPVKTSPYCIDMRPMYVKDIKAKMLDQDERKRWLPLSDGDLMASITAHGDSTRLTRDAPRQDPKGQATAINDFTIVWVHENVVEWNGEDYVYYTLGDQRLLSSPKPLYDVYFHGMRPYVFGSAILETHRVYKSSLPKISKDIQSEINEVTNQRLDNVKFVLNKRYFVKRNRQVDLRSLTRNIPASVTLMNDPNEDVKVVDTPDVTGSSFNEQDRLNLDFDDLTGVFSQASVQSNRVLNETVGGMNKLESNANQVGEYQLRVFTETWTEPVLRQLMALEREHETDDRIIALAMKSSDEAQAYDPYMLLDQDLNLSVNVGVGATNPQTQLERFAYGVDASIKWFGPSVTQRMDSEEVLKELFGKLGYKDGKRFFLESDEDQTVAALREQIHTLQQELEAKHPRELLDAMVGEINARAEKIRSESVNKSVEAAYSATQAAGAIAMNPQVSGMADAILGSAGFVDKNQAPILPEVSGEMPMDIDMIGNTNPMTPANPGVGLNEGIETQEFDDNE